MVRKRGQARVSQYLTSSYNYTLLTKLISLPSQNCSRSTVEIIFFYMLLTDPLCHSGFGTSLAPYIM